MKKSAWALKERQVNLKTCAAFLSFVYSSLLLLLSGLLFLLAKTACVHFAQDLMRLF